MEKVLIFLRGVPGCGKTTVAEYISKLGMQAAGSVCCADDYHMVNGEYKWKLENQGYAHKSCQSKCESQMKDGISPVIVANTSTTVKEMKPYTELAATYGYKVFSLIVENRHGGVDVHNVPASSLDAMEKRFDIKLR